MKTTITLDQTLSILNGALEKDPVAISELFLKARVRCNEALADHPTIQVRSIQVGLMTECSLGVLGLINGLFGVDERGWGPITMVVTDESPHSVIKF